MCGIYGEWRFQGARVSPRHVHAATSTLRHRGPSDEGYWFVDTALGRRAAYGGDGTDSLLALPPIDSAPRDQFDLALGFRRLAIVDLSVCGHQPMSSADGRHTMVFNGEVYNYRELRTELLALGHTFVSASDSEVVLAAFQEWGASCLDRFNGMWAIAIFDAVHRSLFLARDRFGVKPLYYTNAGGRFAFASEIKALVGPHGIPFRPDPQAIHAFLIDGALPSPRGGSTFFLGVHALVPGHWMRIAADGSAQVQQFWALVPDESAARRSEASVIDDYRELLSDAVRLRLRGDVPVGTCLSGGLDSSSVVGLVNQLMRSNGEDTVQVGSRQKTFSAVYDTDGPYNERRFIDAVLARTQADGHFVVPQADDLWSEMEALVWHTEEPFQTTSIFAQWCVMRLARQRGVTVLLDGQGADESLAGYRPFSLLLGDQLREGRVLGAAREAVAIGRRTGLPVSGVMLRAAATLLPSQARGMRARLQAAHTSDFVSADLSAVATPQPTVLDTGLKAHLRRLHEEGLPHLLRFEDRSSMAFAVEGRVPFLDYRLVQFSAGLPNRFLVRDGWTKWILRQAMRDIVPDAVLWRTDKVGFETPERDWLLQDGYMRGAEWFGQDALSGPYLNLPAVRNALAAPMGQGADLRQFWRMVNLEAWLRVWSRL